MGLENFIISTLMISQITVSVIDLSVSQTLGFPLFFFFLNPISIPQKITSVKRDWMEQSNEITILKPVLILSVNLEGIFPKSPVLLLWFSSDTSNIAFVAMLIAVLLILRTTLLDFSFLDLGT